MFQIGKIHFWADLTWQQYSFEFTRNLQSSITLCRVDNAFLISLVGKRPEKHFWIGLSNQKHIDFFSWTNTDTVTLTHWNAGMPGMKVEFLSVGCYKMWLYNQKLIITPTLTHIQGHRQGCVAMTTGIFAGLWDVLPCTNRTKYICKHLAEGAALTTVPPTTSPPSCVDGWRPLPSRHYCYKVRSAPEWCTAATLIHIKNYFMTEKRS